MRYKTTMFIREPMGLNRRVSYPKELTLKLVDYICIEFQVGQNLQNCSTPNFALGVIMVPKLVGSTLNLALGVISI
jgi:hypothetical protein